MDSGLVYFGDQQPDYILIFYYLFLLCFGHFIITQDKKCNGVQR